KATGGLALPAGRLARPQQLRRIVECREYRRAVGRVYEAQGDALVGVAGLAAHRIQRLADLPAAIMEHRARIVADAALVRDKTRQHPAPAIEPVGIAGAEQRLLRPRIALALPREFLVDPHAVEKFHQREIEDVGPDDRGRAVIAVVVPGAVRGQDQIAARRLAALALDRRIAAILG